MNKFSPDLLIYGLLILGVLIFNYLAQRAAKRRQNESADREPPEQAKPLPEIWGRAQPAPAAVPPPGVMPMPAPAPEAPPVAEEAPRRRSAARSFLRGRGNLRRAMVVMTVLGPCRAQELPGAPASAPAQRSARA